MGGNDRKQHAYDNLMAAGWTDEEMTSFSECREITPQMAHALIDAWDPENLDHGLCRGEFWCHETSAESFDTWLTIDNTTGDCWTEEFRTEDAAKGFLLYGLCAADAYDIDDGNYKLDYLVRRSLQDDAELDDFDSEDYKSPDPEMDKYKKPFENQWEQGKLSPAPAVDREVTATSYALEFPGCEVKLPEETDLTEWLSDPANLAVVKEKAKAVIDRASIHEINCWDKLTERIPANELDTRPASILHMEARDKDIEDELPLIGTEARVSDDLVVSEGYEASCLKYVGIVDEGIDAEGAVFAARTTNLNDEGTPVYSILGGTRCLSDLVQSLDCKNGIEMSMNRSTGEINVSVFGESEDSSTKTTLRELTDIDARDQAMYALDDAPSVATYRAAAKNLFEAEDAHGTAVASTLLATASGEEERTPMQHETAFREQTSIDDVIGTCKTQAGLSAGVKDNPGRDNEKEIRR